MKRDWPTIETNLIIKELASSTNGLSLNQIKVNTNKYGTNNLVQNYKINFLKIFLKKFLSPLVILLLIAATMCIINDQLAEAIFSFVIIMVDTLLRTFQEWKIWQKNIFIPNIKHGKSTVIRERKSIEINNNDIVVGDIVVLKAGDLVPADCRLITINNLSVDESCLTGDTTNIYKNTKLLKNNTPLDKITNMLFTGSTITSGQATAIVVEIGKNTVTGQIIASINNNKIKPSPLTIKIQKIIRNIGMSLAILALIIAITLHFEGYLMSEIFFSITALTVSAIPEGLAIALIVTLSLTIRKLNKKNIVLKNLNTVENLTSCNVIISNQKGILTINEPTVKIIELADGSLYDVNGTGYNNKGSIESTNRNSNKKVNLDLINNLATLVFLNNNSNLNYTNRKWHYSGNEMDIACKFLTEKIKDTDEINRKYKIITKISDDTSSTTTFLSFGKKVIVTSKGSIDYILKKCDSMYLGDDIKPIDKEYLKRRSEELSALGYQVMAVSCNQVVTNKNTYTKEDIPRMIFIGLIGFIDPIGKNTIKAINQYNKVGIKVVMISENHPMTAFTTAKNIKIADNYNQVATAKDIDQNFKLGYEKFDQYISSITVFSKITAGQKLIIIESLKRSGNVVATTGSKFSDIPAFKSSDISITTQTSAKIAKETSNMIIADDEFISIFNGINECHHAYFNIRKIIWFLISCGLSEVLFFILAILFGLPIPLLAIQILWLNLITNSIHNVGLAMEKNTNDAINFKPINPNSSIFDKKLITEILISGITIGLSIFLLWYFLTKALKIDVVIARSYILIAMILVQNIHIFNCRSEEKSIFKMPIKNNKFIFFGVIITILLQILIYQSKTLSDFLNIYPISINNLFITLLFTLPIIIVTELYKKKRVDNNV